MRRQLRRQRRRPFVLITALFVIIIGTALLTSNTSVTLPWMHWIIDIVTILLILIGIAIWTIHNQHLFIKRFLTATLTGKQTVALMVCLVIGIGTITGLFNNPLMGAALNAFGALLALLLWAFEREEERSPSSRTPPSAPEPEYRSLEGSRPPTDPESIEQRKELVQSMYQELIQQNTTAIMLLSIAGAGKSTLASLIAKYAEEQRRLFTAEPLWITVDSVATMIDLVGTLFSAQNEPVPALNSLAPAAQAEAMIKVLNKQPRLVILDQFDNFLRTDLAPEDDASLKEWLNAINSRPCVSRVLMTSCSRPDLPLLVHMHVHIVAGLKDDEGIELLKKQRVEISEQE